MKHFINDIEVTPRNLEDIGILVDYSKVVQQEAVNVDSLILPMNGYQEVMNNLQVTGISEGIPYYIEFNGKKNPYYIDLMDSLKVRSNEVEVTIKQRYSHDNFSENASSLTFDYLNSIKELKTYDLGYKIVPNDALIKGLVISVTIYTINRTMQDQVRELQKTLKEFTSIISYSPFPLGKAVEAGIQLSIQIAYLAVLVYQVRRLSQQLVELIYPKTRFLKCAYVYDLMKAGCEHLGYSFKSSILETNYQRLAVVSVPQNKEKKKLLDYLENELNFAFNTGYPTIIETTPTLGSLFEAMQTMFNAKIRVKNKVVEFERWDYWQKNSNFLNLGLPIQDKALDEFRIDTSKNFKRYLIKYLTDFSDLSTYDNFEGNTAEYSNERLTIKNNDLNILKGLTNASIPFARAKRKDKLTWLDKQFKGMFKTIDLIAGTNYANKKDTRGYMIVTSQFFVVPKLIIHDGNNKIAETQIIEPTYLWDNFHSINNPSLYQYITREKVPMAITNEQFLALLEDNYATINGKKCELISIEYFPMKNKALVSYKEQTNLFKNNSKIIKIY